MIIIIVQLFLSVQINTSFCWPPMVLLYIMTSLDVYISIRFCCRVHLGCRDGACKGVSYLLRSTPTPSVIGNKIGRLLCYLRNRCRSPNVHIVQFFGQSTPAFSCQPCTSYYQLVDCVFCIQLLVSVSVIVQVIKSFLHFSSLLSTTFFLGLVKRFPVY